MLNRLYIVIGALAILALAAAFVVPRFINWGDFRGRIEAMASDALGAPVVVRGDIAFQLLPQPRLELTDVAVGDPASPGLSVARVAAEFPLFDILRDRYQITRLQLDQPELELGVGIDGALVGGLVLAPKATGGAVGFDAISITGGTVTLNDARSGVVRAEAISGDLRLAADGGPISFIGAGALGDTSYTMRVSVALLGEGARAKVSVFAQPTDQSASLAAEGELVLGAAPQFVGNVTVRARPPAIREDLVRGDLVLTSAVEAGFGRVLLSAYTIVPDENRAATRLTGAASLTLGAKPSFDAVISGGVLALPPRDVTTEEAVVPFELVRLLAELPTPPVLGVPGSIGVDISELSLRDIAVRNVRFDALSGPDGWTIKNFSAVLPGGGAVRLDGVLSAVDKRPHFEGALALETKRLDALALLWRRPAPNNPLFGKSGRLTANVNLTEDTLTLAGGQFLLGEVPSAFGAVIGFGASRRLELAANFGTFDEADSAAFGALLPDLSPAGSFGVTFPRGSVTLNGEAATVLGLNGQGLFAEGNWEGGVLQLTSLGARDLGGAKFKVSLTAFGTVMHPELFGDGTLEIAEAGAPAVDRLLDLLAAPPMLRDILSRSVPANLAVRLDTPGGDGGQNLALAGHAGAGEVRADIRLASGLARVLGVPVDISLDLVSPEIGALGAQLGFGDAPLLSSEDPMHVALTMQGMASNSLETNLTLESGTDSLAFSGNVVVSDPLRWSGSGVVRATLAEPDALAANLGAGAISLPPFAATAQLNFSGLDAVQLSAIDARSGEGRLTGLLELRRSGETRTLSGDLETGALDINALATTVLGGAALVAGEGVWPEGPISGMTAARAVGGKIHISAPALLVGERRVLDGIGFDLEWDATAVRLRNLTGAAGQGTVTLDVGVCCAGPLADRLLSIRLGLADADLTLLLPAGATGGLSGNVSGAAQFEGTGASLRAIVGGLAGTGNFEVTDLEIAGFDGGAFAEIAGLESVLDLQPEDLAVLVRQALEQGPLAVPRIAGSFTIAGGVLRSPNLTAETAEARLFGGSTINLVDLSLEGAYKLTPVGRLGADGFINATTTEVTARLGGTVLDPVREFDVSAMVDAVQVHAYEVELAALEKLRAEDEARAKAAAEARARQLAAEREAKRIADTSAAIAEALALVAAGEVADIIIADAVVATAERVAGAELARIEAARRAAAPPPRPVQPATRSTPRPETLSPLVLSPVEPASRF